MEQISNDLRVSYSDKEINALLEGIGDEQPPFTRHFNQSEDFFIQLGVEYTVPHLSIHHDVRQAHPSPDYIASLRGIAAQLAKHAPQVFRGLLYFFDPAEILRPCFYRIYRIEDTLYLYLLRVDLAMRAADCRVIDRGTNDTTPAYKTHRLFLEATVIPLSEVVRLEGKVCGFRIRQTISQTWIGEFGRGYFQQGIWMDADLTKFFSKLFLPVGKRIYPYFPYLCKYKTVCHAAIRLSPESRALIVPLLHRALHFLAPMMERVQAEMKNEAFSESMPVFRDLKEKIPAAWYDPWKNIRMEAYLNDTEAKEYRVDD